MNIGNLISGLIGALIATILAIVYDFYMQRMRLRAEVSIIVLSWVDGIYCQMQYLQGQAEGLYTDGKLLLTQDEYNATCRELRNQLLSDELEVRLALIYGKDSEEVWLFNSLQKRLMEVALILWSAKKETWKEIEQKILNKFSQDVDPLRFEFKKKLLRKASAKFFFTTSIKGWPLSLIGLGLDFVGTLLLAVSIKIFPVTQIYGMYMELGGKELELPIINAQLFYGGLALLIIGFVLIFIDQFYQWRIPQQKKPSIVLQSTSGK